MLNTSGSIQRGTLLSIIQESQSSTPIWVVCTSKQRPERRAQVSIYIVVLVAQLTFFKLDQNCYQLGTGCFSVYGFEYKPGKRLDSSHE